CLPGMSGVELMGRIRAGSPSTAVIMTTGVRDADTIVTAMKAGASDYILKPFSLDHVAMSVAAAIERRNSLIESRSYLESLERRVQTGSEQLKQLNGEMCDLLANIIQSLAYSLEAKDPHTEGHSRKVARYAGMIAQQLGQSEDKLGRVAYAGLLHDIGKIAVRESILTKPGPLSPREYSHIKQHPLISERILRPIKQFADILTDVRNHHEFFDGRGYPDGLKGESIPIGARILAVADAYDAMTSGRVYREKLPPSEAFAELQAQAGKQFDPEVVQAFAHAMRDETWRT
ncbi:MAG: HD domain-containing protein, partial [Planctomycetes bacterium]|nr:HD domain-containing protein [Planctomycetota bacterium]MBM4086866.1 HD domain-containing protein [Planctomycetota bacterium]